MSTALPRPQATWLRSARVSGEATAPGSCTVVADHPALRARL
ncbi:hypothetical protein [Streptomyces sp. 3211.6]|nr:hypothetical protein [Streptomyces sp. 3211.6]